MTTYPSSQIRGKDTGTMQKLSSTTTQTLYWDFSDSENFYVFDSSLNTLYLVSPNQAYLWFGQNPSNVSIYNPFLTASPRNSTLSTIV